jgi:hypothetical protein
MVIQHNIRFLVVLGTLVVAYWLIFPFPSYIVVRMHILIDRRVLLEYPPISIVTFLLISLALYLPLTHIVDTSHITYTLVLPSIIRVLFTVLAHARYLPRFYTGLYCADVPRNLFFTKKIQSKDHKVLIERLMLETASLVGSN